jgi:hypothetical protein
MLRLCGFCVVMLVLPGSLPVAAVVKEKDKDKEKKKSIFANRTGEAKVDALTTFGGTDESEQAVRAGLAWLLRQQMPDGRWKINGNFPDKAPNANDVAATAMAILPMLGAGYTHKSPTKGEPAPYTKAIQSGLQFLIRSQNPKSGEFGSGGYAHGLAAQALCEAYGMTKDPALKRPAQGAVFFLVTTQHNQGGWRYSPKTAGDMSVTGWQLMALHIAQRSGLDVHKNALKGGIFFLDSCCDKDNEAYGYTSNTNTSPSCTAIGLLCRQHVQEWGPDHPRLSKGIKNHLASWKPDPKQPNCYMNYYAAQTLFHFGGDAWKDWNEMMRDRLIKSQNESKDARLAGSWYDPGDQHGRGGGRLMQTSFNLLILETYYRYLPHHGKPAQE